MRVAVIGAGVAGLVSAWILARRHDVELFEASDRIGGHVHTHSIDERGTKRSIDSGFIVFNRRTYPNFVRLLELLGVEAQLSNMSFSVRVEANGLEYNGTSINSLFAQRTNFFRPSFHRMLRDILRFNRAAKELARSEDEHTTLGEFLGRGQYGREFVEYYLVPMGAAVWSTAPGRMREFPALAFARFFENHGFLEVDDRPPWYTVRGGSKRYVDALLASFRGRVRAATPIRSIRRGAEFVELAPAAGEAERFDQVVIAAHSDQALAMLVDASDAEREVLGAIPYQRNRAILHTDAALLPKRRLARAAWNYHVGVADDAKPALTYWMNRLQAIDSSTTYCVTLNREAAIGPTRRLAAMDYEHPLYTQDAPPAQRRWAEINGSRRTWFAGAYWSNGFHEDGVKSALAVVGGFGLGLEP